MRSCNASGKSSPLLQVGLELSAKDGDVGGLLSRDWMGEELRVEGGDD